MGVLLEELANGWILVQLIEEHLLINLIKGADSTEDRSADLKKIIRFGGS